MLKAEDSFLGKIDLLEATAHNDHSITLQCITSILGHSSHYLLNILLSIPFLQPIPLLGLSPFIGPLIAFSGILILCNRRLYIPKRFKQHEVAAKKIEKVCRLTKRFFEWSHRWMHPRGRFMSRQTLVRRLNGGLIAVSGILLALPIPFPATNTLPAAAIIAISLGSLKEDGLVIAIGWLLCAAASLYILFLISLPIILSQHIAP